MGQRGEPSPIGVGQSKAPAIQLPAQQAILFNQISDCVSLATLQPAGDDQQQHSQSRDVKHGGESISETGFHAAASIPSWNTTAASTLFALSAGEAIGGWRFGRRRRVLLLQRELSLQIGDTLRLLGDLAPRWASSRRKRSFACFRRSSVSLRRCRFGRDTRHTVRRSDQFVQPPELLRMQFEPKLKVIVSCRRNELRPA